MRALDRVFGCLLVWRHRACDGILQGIQQPADDSVVGALGLLCRNLIGGCELLRAGRKGDRSLAWISFAGCVVWIGFVLSFGLLIGNVFDFRPLVNLIITLALAIFSLRSALRL